MLNVKKWMKVAADTISVFMWFFWLSVILLACIIVALMAADARGQDINEIYSKYAQSICRIKAGPYERQGMKLTGYGTGTYIGGKWVLSAKHVTEDHIAICQFKNEQLPVVYRVNDATGKDIVLLKMSEVPRTAVAVPIANGEPRGKVLMAGFDHGNVNQLRFFTGRIDGRWVGVHGFAPVLSQTAVSGNSGGPVFNEAGQLIGNLYAANHQHTIANRNSYVRDFIQRAANKLGEEIAGFKPVQEKQQRIFGWGTQPQPAPGGS